MGVLIGVLLAGLGAPAAPVAAKDPTPQADPCPRPFLRTAETQAAAGDCGETPLQPQRGVSALAEPAVPSGFISSTAISGLDQPTNVAFAADGRVFVAEKTGRIKVFSDLDDPTPTTYTGLTTNVLDFWDRGLLGFALDPSLTDTSLPSRPWIYVLYSYDHVLGSGSAAPRWGDTCPTPPGPNTDGCLASGRLSRLTVSGDTISGPETVLVEDWCQQMSSHSVAALRFGPDGYLYASGGDGASYTQVDYGQMGGTLPNTTSPLIPKNPCGDPPGDGMTAPTAEGGALRTQDVRTTGDPTGLDGSVIRIDPITGAAAPGNPFITSSDLNTRRIIAHGFRNPFRMDFRPGTDELWVGDVGWNTWEELNRIADANDGVAENFGWPCYEGTGRQSGYDAANLDLCETLYTAGTATGPQLTYRHTATVTTGEDCPTGSSSISGVTFYPLSGGSFPSRFAGGLFFSDHNRGCIWFAPAAANGQPDMSRVELFADNPEGAPGPVGLTIGPNGDLFYPDIADGAIIRVAAVPDGDPTARIVATPTSGPAPLTVAFDGRTSTDPEAGPLTYAWDLDGDGQYDDSTSATPGWTYDNAGTVTVRLRVTDQVTRTGTTSTTITVQVPANTPPVPVIATPTSTTKWGVGDVVSFSGSATDAQDGTLAASRLSWELVMHHCPSNCHEHDIETFSGVASGSFVAPDHDYPSHLELILTATDSNGVKASVSRSIDPRTAVVTFTTSPAGLQLAVGADEGVGPFQRTFIDKSVVSIAAPGPQTLGGTTYAFSTWSDGKAATHSIVATNGATYTATFVPVTIASSTTLSTLTDDGVAAGESVTLVARVTTAQSVSGGTLRIRDLTTNGILASATVSGRTTTLQHAVTRSLGSWSFRAEFVPGAPNVAASSGSRTITVVAGPRPSTTMDTATIYTKALSTSTTFSSPTGGVTFQCRIAGGSWSTCASPWTPSVTSDGDRLLEVRARRSDGLADRTPAARHWIVDRVAPTATAPARAIRSGLTSGKVTVRASWSGTDSRSGIARYELALQTNGGAWTTLSTTLTSALRDQALSTEQTYRFRVRAVDRAGNVGPWTTGASFRLRRFSENNSAVRFSSGWSTQKHAAFWLGAAKYSKKAGATASLTFTGRSIGWVARRGPDRGVADIYVDGVKVATVDLYRSTALNQQVVWTRSWSSNARHTVTVRVRGTAGRPRVDVDAFVTND